MRQQQRVLALTPVRQRPLGVAQIKRGASYATIEALDFQLCGVCTFARAWSVTGDCMSLPGRPKGEYTAMRSMEVA